tara:strand:+ start:289 stop:1155 length:867 start_codon:yes stop_codon:yes gene_type:complete
LGTEKNIVKIVKNKLHIKPKKRLGQNFIFDKNILYKIAGFIEPIKGYLVIEIGPGLGGLSKALIKKNPKHIILIEKDYDLKKILFDIKKEFINIDIKIIFNDFLKVELNKIDIYKKNKVKYISNLPYYIATQILMKIIPFEENVKEAIFMFQKEVAKRLLAQPNNKSYSKLSVVVQHACKIKNLYNLKSNVFYPKPEVESCLLSFLPKNNIKIEVCYAVKKITNLAFQKRRKTIKNSLASMKGINELLEKLDINPNSRAENITVEQYTKLANLALKKKLIQYLPDKIT